MSAWDIIEEFLQRQPVGLTLMPREVYAVREATAMLMKRGLGSAWSLMEAQVLIKGLTPQELEVIKQQVGNVQAKQGNSGMVVALDPRSWLKIRQELEANREYYEWMLKGGSIDDLLKKISSVTGGLGPQAPAQTAPAASGPQLPPLSKPMGGTGGGSPFANKVRQQDIAGMAGSTIQQKDISGKLVKPGDEPEIDTSNWADEL